MDVAKKKYRDTYAHFEKKPMDFFEKGKKMSKRKLNIRDGQGRCYGDAGSKLACALIAEYVEDEDITFHEFSEMCGWDPARTSNYYSGRVEPKLKTMITIEKITEGYVPISSSAESA